MSGHGDLEERLMRNASAQFHKCFQVSQTFNENTGLEEGLLFLV